MKNEKFFKHNATASDNEKYLVRSIEKEGFFFPGKGHLSWLITPRLLRGYGLLTAYPCVKQSVKETRNYLINKIDMCYTCARNKIKMR